MKDIRNIKKKILFFTLGKENLASSRVRVYDYLPYLKKAGFDYYVISYVSAWFYRLFAKEKDSLFFKALNKIYSWVNLLRVVFKARNFDIIFIQRVLINRFIFKIIKKLNHNIVFDFDDAVYLADKLSNPKELKNNFLEKFNFIARNSKCIITTQSDFNQSIARSLNKNVVTITTPVNTKRFAPADYKNKNAVIIGWIGNPQTTCYLYKLKDVFAVISKKYSNVRIEFIGAKRFGLNGAQAIFKNWSIGTEVQDLQNFDIGIMPLEDDEWSRNKYYKLLQYFALGIPVVASAVGVCKSIVDDGINGFLANDSKDWVERLSVLIEDSELRKTMGARAREKAEHNFSYEVTAPILINTLKNTIID